MHISTALGLFNPTCCLVAGGTKTAILSICNQIKRQKLIGSEGGLDISGSLCIYNIGVVDKDTSNHPKCCLVTGVSNQGFLKVAFTCVHQVWACHVG